MAFTQNDDNQEQTQQNGALTTGGGQGSAVGNTPGAGPVSTANPNKQGSGRFTNLSKYVQANKQGSENLANRIGSGIQNQLSANEKDVSGKTSKLDTDIKSGDATLQTAGAEEQRLKSIGDQFKANQNFKVLDANSRGQFGDAQNQIKQFVASNPNYNTFKTAQAGSAVDEAALSNQLNDTRQTANQYENLFKQRQGQVGNTQGREQALQEFVGGANQAVRPTYTSGQRKLDQLILGQNAQNLQGLINKVGANQTNVNQALNTVGNLDTGLNTLKTNEQNLMKAIGDTSKGAQSAFQSAFNQDKINEVNAARQNAFQTASDDLSREEIAGDLYDKAGLGNLQSLATFNALQGKDFGVNNRLSNDFFQRDADAQRAQDIVNADDVDTDKLLADIAGGGQKFTQAGNLNTSVGLRTDESGNALLRNALTNEQQRQQQQAVDTMFAGEGNRGWSRSGPFGIKTAGGNESARASGTVADLLSGRQYLSALGTEGMVNTGRNESAPNTEFNAKSFLENSALLGSGAGMANLAGQAMEGSLGKALGIGSDRGQAVNEAIQDANNQLYGQLQNYVTQNRYGSTLRRK